MPASVEVEDIFGHRKGRCGVATTMLSTEQLRRGNLYLAASAGCEPLPPEATVEDLVQHEHVNATLLAALDVTPPQLLHHGATLDDMLALGYDASTLVRSAATTASFVKAFGKPKVAVAVLKSAEDAKLLAGTFAASQLGVSNRMLLEACAGCRTAALAVIEKLLHAAVEQPNQGATVAPAAKPSAPLAGCASHLARLGVDGRTLCDTFGLHIDLLAPLLEASAADLATLGVFFEPQR